MPPPPQAALGPAPLAAALLQGAGAPSEVEPRRGRRRGPGSAARGGSAGPAGGPALLSAVTWFGLCWRRRAPMSSAVPVLSVKSLSSFVFYCLLYRGVAEEGRR